MGLMEGTGSAEPAVDVKALHAKISERMLENDFLGAAPPKRVCQAQDDDCPHPHPLCVTKQALVLGIRRGCVYYQPKLLS